MFLSEHQTTIMNDAKLQIAIIGFNRADLLGLQVESLRRFIASPFECFLVNNAPNLLHAQALGKAARKAGIASRDIALPSKAKGPSVNHGHALNATFQMVYGMHDGIFLILDHDMFLCRNLDVDELMSGYQVAGGIQWRQRQRKVWYVWPNTIFLNMGLLPAQSCIDFTPDQRRHLDTGGKLTGYYQRPDVHVRPLLHTSRIHSSRGNLSYFPTKVLDYYDEDFACEFLGHYFLHYAVASGWTRFENERGDYQKRKKAFVERFVKDCIDHDMWQSWIAERLTDVEFESRFSEQKLMESIR